jgi:hypothetical protein
MSTSPLTAWHISESDFPQQGTPAKQLQFLIKYAVLAPSGHNTQPWLFNHEERPSDALHPSLNDSRPSFPHRFPKFFSYKRLKGEKQISGDRNPLQALRA